MSSTICSHQLLPQVAPRPEVFAASPGQPVCIIIPSTELHSQRLKELMHCGPEVLLVLQVGMK